MSVMMNDSTPIPERRKVVKSYKNVLPAKQTVAVDVWGRPSSKMNVRIYK